ncbi:MAG: PEP/pyruvate-binding domain-containing protein [Chitinophagales bacterium]
MKALCLALLLFPILIWAQTKKECAYKGGQVAYLNEIRCRNDYHAMKGPPLSEKYGNVESVKLLYEIKKDRIFFANSELYHFHYDFSTQVLGDGMDLPTFNATQYTDNDDRRYVLANLNHYMSSDLYTLEFFSGDDFRDTFMLLFFKKLKEQTYFGSRIKVLVNSPETEQHYAHLKNEIPFISVNELYAGQNYQMLIKGTAYGYLRKIPAKQIDSVRPGDHDILLTDGLPNDIPLVAGVVTTQFQTPLCHVNILCHNRNTPNAAWKKAWNDSLVNALEGKLVRLDVSSYSVKIKPADSKDAEQYWRTRAVSKSIQLSFDTLTTGLQDLKNLSYKSVNKVGGKAANFAELSKIIVYGKKLPLPENGFAIPLSYYYSHIQRNGIQPFIDSILQTDSIRKNPERLSAALKELRKKITKAPLDSNLLIALKTRLAKDTVYKAYRFRSSTNAEDVPGFNGAGLYTSKTGSFADTSKTVEKAIKKVWASLWEDRAFYEREYFHINQRSVMMGILVHRAFGDEEANGVAVTKHLYRPAYPAYTINVQKGETSIVLPTDTSVCDQLIAGLGEVIPDLSTSIEYITHSSVNNGKSVMKDEEVLWLVRYLKAIKDHYFFETRVRGRDVGYNEFAMDVEFKLDKGTRKLYIKQARVY